MKLFISGLIIGVLVSAPIGPIGALCIHRALNNGFKVAFITGLGAALADVVCAVVIGFGLTFVSSIFIAHQTELQFIGGVFLLYLGMRQYLRSPRNLLIRNDSHTLWVTLASSFLLTLTNPASLLLLLALITGFGLAQLPLDWIQKVFFILGLFLGATFIWFILSASAAFLFKKYLSPNSLKLLNFIFGTLFLILGLIILSKLAMVFIT